MNLIVQVSDMGKPRLSSELTATVQISVKNVNDCPPVFTQNVYNATILLPTFENVVVVQVNATDQDGFTDNDTLHYEFGEGSNVDGTFAIHSITGIITTR